MNARWIAPLLTALVVVSAALGAPADASAQAPTRQRVRAMLSGIEDVPSAEDWRRVGERVLPILMELANDSREAPFVRLRAIGATAAFPRPAVRTFLRAVASVEGQSDLFVSEAVNALGRGFGRAAVEELESYLRHPEPLVRENAARQLGRIGGRDARQALQAQLRAERAPHVRATIERALATP